MQKTVAWLPVVGVIGLTWIVYAQTGRFAFVQLDDRRYILENPTVRDGFTADNVVWACTTPYFGNWHPLTTLSWMLDVEMSGVDAGRMHLTNVMWHTANVLLTRDPVEMLPSYAEVVEAPTLADVGYAAHVELLDYLEALGQDPPVLDAGEVLRDPRGVL